MRLNIGNEIKYLRKEKDITQDELAEVLGVSCQSVSRWENGVCYPDLEMLPAISDFFGITVDKLLGVNKVIEEERVAQYLERFREALSQGRVYDCIAVAREGLSEYPNNFTLLNKLMYALFIAGDDDGNIPEWEENAKKNDAEICALGERIMKYCPDQNIRLEAAARLAFNHCEMGRKEIGRALYETLPPAEFCKENQMWWSLSGDERLPFFQDKIRRECGELSNDMRLLASCGQLCDEQYVIVMQKIRKLNELIYDGNVSVDGWADANWHVAIAKAYARLGDTSKVFEHLNAGAQAARKFDECSGKQTFCSVLLGEITVDRLDFETCDTRTRCEIMRDKWLSAEDFDALRDTDEFRAIIRRLS